MGLRRLFRDWSWKRCRDRPVHLVRGERGEAAARRFLKRQGLQFLQANFKSRRGEIDLIFSDRRENALVFVEVKTRTWREGIFPADAVTTRKKRSLSRCALDYLRLTGHPKVAIRFDIVEVLLVGNTVREIRHLPAAFTLSKPYFY